MNKLFPKYWQTLMITFCVFIPLGLTECTPHNREPLSFDANESIQRDTRSITERRIIRRDHTQAKTIGRTCQDNQDCPSHLECETRIPSGYCTKQCTTSTQCPTGSACVRIRFKEGPQYLRCLQTCRQDSDCREQFTCYHPPGAWKLICLPTLPAP